MTSYHCVCYFAINELSVTVVSRIFGRPVFIRERERERERERVTRLADSDYTITKLSI